jgi:hypothetical protein
MRRGIDRLPICEVSWEDGRGTPSVEARFLEGFGRRLRGLLGTDDTAPPVILEPCRAIHTFGMGYAIDVAFVASDGKVTRAERGVGARRHLESSGARWVLERPASSGPWPEAGMRIKRIPMNEGRQGG